LVQPDAYGTVSVDKWEKEKQKYIDTRILPLNYVKGLGKWYGQVAYWINQLIEEAAQRPIQAGGADIARFASNPEAFDLRMNPRDYELHCALQLEKVGWSTRLTTVTGDQGADVIAHRSGKILVVQCKLYSQPVGNDAIQQVHAARFPVSRYRSRRIKSTLYKVRASTCKRDRHPFAPSRATLPVYWLTRLAMPPSGESGAPCGPLTSRLPPKQFAFTDERNCRRHQSSFWFDDLLITGQRLLPFPPPPRAPACRPT
jgi:hypothetical protein